MTRTHGRAPRGQRLVAAVPHVRWSTMTFLAALRSGGITAPCVFDGPINGCVFLAWMTQFLAPALKAGVVVVLDNLGSHKGAAVRRVKLTQFGGAVQAHQRRLRDAQDTATLFP